MSDFYAFALKMADEHSFLTFTALCAIGCFGKLFSTRHTTNTRVEVKLPKIEE